MLHLRELVAIKYPYGATETNSLLRFVYFDVKYFLLKNIFSTKSFLVGGGKSRRNYFPKNIFQLLALTEYERPQKMAMRTPAM